MLLWRSWWEALWLLRPGCTHLRTFLWFAVTVAGLSIRPDLPGVTSIVRALGLHGRFYNSLLDNFHSIGIKLGTMTVLWVRAVLKLLYQESESNRERPRTYGKKIALHSPFNGAQAMMTRTASPVYGED